MIVDTHSHVWLYPEHLSEEVAREFAAARVRRRRVARQLAGGAAGPGETDAVDPASVTITPAMHWAHAQQCDLSVVLAFRSRALGIDVPNEYVAAYVAEHPDRLVGFACVDPNDGDAPDELEHCVTQLGMRGLKLGPIYQHFDPTERRFFPLYARVAALGIPILWHMGATVLRRAPLKVSNPLLLQEVALAFPEVRMIVAHLGHPWELETIVLLRQSPNLWADVSALHTRPWRLYLSLMTAVEYGVADRLLLASDFSAGTIPDTLAALRDVNRWVEGTPLPRVPDEVIAGILHENWRGILDAPPVTGARS